MSLPVNYEYECTKRCRSTVHGNKITAASSKRSISDLTLSSFVMKLCKNFPEVADQEGRTALHLAASTNRAVIVEWLIKNGANVDAKDLESGQTPLHRALFYGCIKSAIILLQNGASMDIHDVEYLSPLHYCMTSNKRKLNRRNDTETYAFGSNSHYNLGLDMDQGTSVPKSIEFFKRNNISIKSAALSPFHSLFLSYSGEFYAVGHGIGGRLGHGQESTVVQPQKINLRLKRTDEKIVSFSASKNHSLILTNLNHIYACGSNSKGQLGVRSNEANLFEFKNINCAELQDENLVRVIALENHSIAYGNDSVFAWGQNTGQLGLRTTAESILQTPQRVLSGQQILLLDACNTGLAFYSGNKFLNVFNNFKMKFFKTPSLEVIKQLAVGDADKLLKVLVMTESYQIYIWDDSSQKYTKCFYASCRQLDISKMFWSGNRIVFLASEDVLISTGMNVVNYNESDDVSEYQEIYSTKKDICQTSRIKISLKRVPFASSVRDVWSDYDGLNCIFTRDDPYMHLKVPTIHDLEVPLDVLYEEMSEMDGIHDVLFHVEREVFPAHKYVLLSRAPNCFQSWIESAEDNKNCYLDVEGLTAVAFEFILRIVYRNHILSEDDLKRLNASYRKSGDAPVHTFQRLMKKLQLGEFLEKSKKNMPRMQFDRNLLPELYDVTIRCANDRAIPAHKCILVSRLKYFNMMFSSSWMETSEVNFTSIPVEYVEVLIDFLYDNSSSRLLSKKYSEAFVTNMIVIADQLFADRLKDIFQVHVLKRYTMKRSVEWLELAFTYHCDLLKKTLFDFISANLREVLENRFLEHCDLDYLTELDERYKEMFPEIKYRQVVPSPAIQDDYIESFAKDFVVDLSVGVTLSATKKSTTKASKEPKSATKTKADYEKEGKLLLLQLQVETATNNEETPTKSDKSLANILSEESSKVLTDLQEKNKALWTKVADKKPETKRKILNANEVLRNEEKMCENFSNLKLALKDKECTPEQVQFLSSSPGGGGGGQEELPSQFNSPISFGDFFSPPSSTGGGRLSQKQRKRQNSRVSESEGGGGDSPGVCRVPENVWNIPNVPDVAAAATNGTDLGAKKKTAKEDKNKQQRQQKKPHEARMINFDDILLDERREREYFAKLKTKSLALTQLEESAIGELLAFYNADQVYDETIVIARKVRHQVSQSFSQWARPSEVTARNDCNGRGGGGGAVGRTRTTSSSCNTTDYAGATVSAGAVVL